MYYLLALVFTICIPFSLFVGLAANSAAVAAALGFICLGAAIYFMHKAEVRMSGYY